MSRLIDADELKRAFNGNRYGTKAIEYVIDDMTTVDAIPVQWMKRFANERALNDGMDCYWHFWGTDLLQMIGQWEKENGEDSE